jgi:hypothetical protein
MDQVEFTIKGNHGNRLTMVKRLPAKGEGL